MYITKEEYCEIYDSVDDKTFNRLEYEARRVMDKYTTGVDGIKKLRQFFPQDEENTEAVKYCAAKLIHILIQLQNAETAATQGRGYETTEMGMRGKTIKTISSGNESISFSAEADGAATVIDAAVADKDVMDRLLADTVREGLAGIKDSNGVNLLYMGTYPRRRV